MGYGPPTKGGSYEPIDSQQCLTQQLAVVIIYEAYRRALSSTTQRIRDVPITRGRSSLPAMTLKKNTLQYITGSAHRPCPSALPSVDQNRTRSSMIYDC